MSAERDRRNENRLARPACAAIAVATCLAATACGGHAVTKKDVIARANGICVSTLRAVRAIAPPTGSSLAALAAYLGKVEPIITKEASDTRGLPRPTKDRGVLDRYVAAVSAGASDYRAAATAAKNGDAAGVTHALSALRANPSPALAARYGLTECSAAAGTKAP